MSILKTCCSGRHNKTLWILALLFVLVSYITQLVLLQKTHNVNHPATDWAWVGCLQSNQATFRVRSPLGTTRRLVVWKEDGTAVLSQTLVFDLDEVQAGYAHNLVPDTAYTYHVMEEEDTIKWSGSFRTPPSEGSRFSFTIAAGGCSMTGSQHRVFQDIRQHSPLLMLHMGDFHYEDLKTTNLNKRLNAFDLVMGSDTQSQFYANTPIAYMWDDHDYVGNDSDGSDVPARDAARQSYQLMVPHCPLPATVETNGPASPYHAFTIGTVRFIISDVRSESTKGSRIYSPAQQAWLYEELAQFEAYDFVVWATSRPWIGSSDDTWSGFPQDRQTLSNHLADIQIHNLLLVSSDNHQVAFDDGTHTDFSSNDNNNASAHFPVIHAGPLSNLGAKPWNSVFSEGCIGYFGEINHQYVTIKFDFSSDESCVDLTAYRSSESPNELILEKRLCNPLVKKPIVPASSTCSTKVFSAKGKGIYWTYFCLSLLFFGLTVWRSRGWKEIACLVTWYVLSCFTTLIASVLAMLTWGLSLVDFIAVGSILLVQAFGSCAYMLWWRLANDNNSEAEIQDEDAADGTGLKRPVSEGGAEALKEKARQLDEDTK